MTALTDLPPDRRAVLQLLVGRGRGYDQIAELLDLPEIVVRRRAHDAITTLAGDAAELPDARRALLCDYLVGELPASRRAEARKILSEDPAARRFSRAAAARLSAIPGAQLPELPAEGEEVAEALDALDARRERKAELERESRKGGWLLVAAVAAVVVAAVVALSVFAGGDGDEAPQSRPGQDTPAATSRTAYAVDLASPSGGPANGSALLRPNAQGATALALKASGLIPTRRLGGDRFTAYAFWLEGPSAEPLRLGFFQPESDDGVTAKDGTLELGVTLNGSVTPAIDSADLERYTTLFITRETLDSADDRPESPGQRVLSGELATAIG